MKGQSIENLVDIAKDIVETPQSPISSADRASVARQLAERFLESKFSNSALQEKLRERILTRLIENVENLSESRLMQLLTHLQEFSVADAAILAGNPSPNNGRGGPGSGGGGDLNIFLGGSPSSGKSSGALISPSQAKFLDSLLLVAEQVINAGSDSESET